MNQNVATAIREKRLLSFTYDNHQRVVEPHCYGLTRTGKEAIRCYQVRGTGKDPHGSPWHLMTMDKVGALQLLEETFATARDGYRRGDKGMATIYCEL